MKTKLIAAFLAAGLAGNCIGTECPQTAVAADETDAMQCTFYEGTNIGRQNYVPTGALNWAMPTASSLVPLSDGTWMKVQAEIGEMLGYVLVEYYDASFVLTKRESVMLEMPLYGCFYQGTDGYYYLLSGQLNTLESNETAVFDIAKYTTDWELVGHDTLSNVNTATPFFGGSARCADDGKHLIIHTCHEIYGNGEGRGHQASITMEVDMEKIKFTDVYSQLNNKAMDYGVVSHSLDQFVLVDDGKLIELDLGDDYPRSVALTSYFTDYTTGQFINHGELFDYRSAATYDLYDINLYEGRYRPSWIPSGFSENSVLNYTGVALGGFVQSSTHYISAFSSINQAEWILHIKDNYPESHKFNDPRNVMVSALSKTALNEEYDTIYNYNQEAANEYKENIEQQVRQYQVTQYTDAEPAAQCPHLTPIGDDRFLLMWQQYDDKVNYTFLDHTGAVDSEIYEMDGVLSDCEPVVKDGAAYWYTWKDADVTFYSIDLKRPESTEKVVSCTKHDYKITYPTETDSHAYETCQKCGKVVKHTPPTNFSVKPMKLKPSVTTGNGGGHVNWGVYHEGFDELDCDWAFTYLVSNSPNSDNPDDNLFEYKVTKGAEWVHEAPEYLSEYPAFLAKHFDGDSLQVEITVYPKFNPSITRTVTYTVSHYDLVEDFVEPTEDHEGLVIWKCAGCDHKKYTRYEPFETTNGMIPEVTLEQDTFVYNGQRNIPDYTFKLVNPQTGEERELLQGYDFKRSIIHDIEPGTAYMMISPLESAYVPAFTGILTVPYTIEPRTQENLTPCAKSHTMKMTAYTLPVYTTKGTETWTCEKCGYETQEVFESFDAGRDYKGEVVFLQDTFEYDHSEHKPKFKFYLTNEETGERTLLLPEIDYNYYYVDNVHAGTAHLVITPQKHTPADAKFKGNFIADFTINPNRLNEGSVIFLPSTYDPEAPETDIFQYIKPAFVVRDKQGYILEEHDYYPKGLYLHDEDDEEYLRMTGVSFSLAAVSPDYTTGISEVYKVPMVDLSDYDAVFADNDLRWSGNAAYTGEAVEPSVNVTTSKGKVLQQDIDYRLVYKDNTARGIATVIVEGIGFYKGTIELHFGIGEGMHPAPPAKKGDVDGNGTVDKADVVDVSKMLTGEIPVTAAADWNKDHMVNAIDYAMMKNAVLNS